MREEYIKCYIPGVKAHISIGNNAKTRIGSTLHFHNEIELIKILDGKMNFTVENDTFTGTKNDIIFIDSERLHQTTPDNSQLTRILLIQFNPKQSYDNYLFKLIDQSEKSFHLFDQNHRLYLELNNLLEQLSFEYHNQKKGYELYLKSLLFALLGFFSRNQIILTESNELDNSLIQKINPVIEYVETNYNQDISLEAAGKILNLHPTYFCKLFKEVTGISFINYLNFVRISKAEDLLIFSDKSITEIAYETGFSNIQYFNKIFKSIKGRTPREFRKISILK